MLYKVIYCLKVFYYNSESGFNLFSSTILNFAYTLQSMLIFLLAKNKNVYFYFY